MDHLPSPNNSASNKRAFVPFVCLKDYDGGPFLSYPVREHVPHALPPDGNIPGGSPYKQHERTYPTPKQEQEDFLQRWLFFGLLTEILGDRYRPKGLICTIETDDGKISIISTSGLVETLDEWVADIQAGLVNPRHTYEHIAECLRLAFATIHGAGPDFDQRVKLSLASLGELFTLATNKAYNVTVNKCPYAFSRLIHDAYWESPMLSSGWCPSQIKVFADFPACLQTLHFLTFPGQPSNGSHQSCNNDRCLDHHNDLATYQTKHVIGCSCEQFLIDTTRLTEILESGSVPLLRIRKGRTLDELSVELVASHSTSRYIALSHVWADGLGNPYENALPRCQLDFLHRTINTFYADLDPEAAEGILLWCDTLCCPIEHGKAKNTALALMKKTYFEATRVLVLDASLRMYDFKTMDADEACIRIVNSGWTRRLWTLQEGALPAKNHRLAFLFNDGPINIRYLKHKVLKVSESSVGRRGLASDIVTQILKFTNVTYESSGDQVRDLGTVEAGLSHRSVSVPWDEPLLIANLLDLDIGEVLNGPCPLPNCTNVGCDHSRIHRLWLLMPGAFRGLPRNVLLRVGPRLSEPGFRWAPSTLLYYEPINTALWPYSRFDSVDLSTTNGPISGAQGVVFSALPHILPVFCSTLLNRLADLFLHMRASLDTAGWVTAIVRNHKRTSLVTERASRGIPTSRGLLVRFAGYSLTMAHCSPGIPSNAWGVNQQAGGGLYSRGIDGTWYLMNRRVPAEQDSFLTTKSLRAVIEEESKLWITHVESAFDSSEAVAEARDEQQVTSGLVVQLLSDEEGIKYVQSKLHIDIGLVRKSTRKLLEAAYQSAKQVSRALPAELTAPKSGSEQNEANDVNSPQYKLILEILEHEIERVATGYASRSVTAAAGDYSKNGFRLFQALIAMMVVGGYGCLGARTRDEQEWCFD